jgi:hypothetical protein
VRSQCPRHAVTVSFAVLLLGACSPGAQEATETPVPSTPTVEVPTATPTATDSDQSGNLDSVDCAAAVPGMAGWPATSSMALCPGTWPLCTATWPIPSP